MLGNKHQESELSKKIVNVSMGHQFFFTEASVFICYYLQFYGFKYL